MDATLPLLKQLFDHLPEAVFFIVGSVVTYQNEAMQTLFPPDGAPPEALLSLLPEENTSLICTHQATRLHASISCFAGGRLVVLRPQAAAQPFLMQAAIPAQLRTHLAHLAASSEQLSAKLASEQPLAPYQMLLRMQAQATYRILRLTRQLELSPDTWELDFTRSMLDFTRLCRELSLELDGRLGKDSVQFRFHCNAAPLLLDGNRDLLEQLIFALLSNALKAAGPDGTVEMSLVQKGQRALLSVWNSGEAIAEDRLFSLFSPQNQTELPRPSEGAGLDLWLAHRVALYHGGVMMAGNRPSGGSAFTLCLPCSAPSKLRFQSATLLPRSDGFTPLLIGLADALPLHAFDPLES